MRDDTDGGAVLTLALVACIVACWTYTLGKADGREDTRMVEHAQE